jgi:hypothetical protein
VWQATVTPAAGDWRDGHSAPVLSLVDSRDHAVAGWRPAAGRSACHIIRGSPLSGCSAACKTLLGHPLQSGTRRTPPKVAAAPSGRSGYPRWGRNWSSRLLAIGVREVAAFVRAPLGLTLRDRRPLRAACPRSGLSKVAWIGCRPRDTRTGPRAGNATAGYHMLVF